MLQQTSLESYLKLKDEGTLANCQKLVLSYILTHPKSSDKEIAEGLKLAINQVTGRRHELTSYGLVKICGRKYDETTKRNVLLWCDSHGSF